MTMRPAGRPLTLALCGSYFLVLLDVTVVNVALPQISSELGADSSGMAWVVDAYAVPLASLLLAAGSIGDRVGHRRVVLLGFTGFGAASALCALAPTIGSLAVARALQGVGAALMLPGTFALLVESAPERTARARLIGLWAAVGGAALPAGPLVGGLVVQTWGWRAVFWLDVPVVALAIIPVLRLRAPARRVVERSTVDWAGGFLLTAALACVVTGILEGGRSMGLAGLFVLASSGLVIGLVRVERRAADPLLRVPARARPALATACLVAGVMNLCALGGLLVLTQLLQGVGGLTPLAAGLCTLPVMLPLPLLGVAAGPLMSRLGAWRTSGLGLLVCAAGFVGIATSVSGREHLVLILCLVLWGAGLGIVTPAIVAASVEAIPSAPGTASGASNTSRQAGGAVGVAVFAAFAGRVRGEDFIPHAATLFAASAVAFLLTALLCLVSARRLRARCATATRPRSAGGTRGSDRARCV